MNLAIIQARMGSTRLPGKILLPLCGKPMLQRIIERVRAATTIDRVIVATTTENLDDPVEKLCSQLGVFCFRGKVDDVLDRYYNAAMLFSPDNVIRITADCPLIDPNVIDLVIRTHIKLGYDYTSNTIMETYPDGLDVEVFSFSVLEKAWGNAQMLSEREHVTPYIKNRDEFKKGSVFIDPSLGDKRWTVDTDKDYEFVNRIYNDLFEENSVFYMEDILRWIDKNRDAELINGDIVRNEGYKLSLLNDKKVNQSV